MRKFWAFGRDPFRDRREDRKDTNGDILTWDNKHVSFAMEEVFALGDELKGRAADVVW